jgi:hypothetical protein
MAKRKEPEPGKCAACIHTRPDKSASEGKWTAYECGNPKSPHFRSLVNASKGGTKHDVITWHGCKCGDYSKGGVQA